MLAQSRKTQECSVNPQNRLGVAPHPQAHATEIQISSTSITTSRRSRRLAKYLSSIIEPVGYQLKHSYTVNLKTLAFALCGGPTLVRRWSGSGREIYSLLPASQGCTICFTFQSTGLWPRRVTILCHGRYQWATFPRLRAHLALQVSALFPYGSPYWIAARAGDLELLRRLLSSGQNSILDTTIHGDTSLHVSFLGTLRAPYN